MTQSFQKKNINSIEMSNDIQSPEILTQIGKCYFNEIATDSGSNEN